MPSEGKNSGILVIGLLPRVVVPIARILRKHGLTVHAASLIHRKPIRSKSIHSFTILTAPDADASRFRQELLALIEQRHIGTIIPTGDEVLQALARVYDECKDRIKFCCPEPNVYRTVLKKELTLKLADTLGIPVPRAYEIPDIDSLGRQRNHIRFPVIAKPRSKEYEERTGVRVRRFDSYGDLERMIERYPEFGQWFLVQEYLPGVGVGVEVLMFNGEPRVLFQHRRVRELPVAGGVSVVAVSEPVDATLSSYAVRLLRALGWQGVAMVEFRQDLGSERLALMEVNGRFWGSIALAGHAGIEFPYYAWQAAQGICPDSVNSYKRGVKFRWLLGDTKRLIQVAVVVLKRKPSSGSGSAWREVAAYFRDFFPPCHDALWNWLDPVPALDELTEILQIVARSVIRGAADILLPKRWIARLKKGSALGKKRAVRYLWLTAFGPKRNELTRLTPFVKRLVFVCHGNIIRSPMAEHLFRKHLEIAQNGDIDVASAGVACIPGNVADPRAVHIASEFGIDLTLHRTEPITQEMVRRTNLFVVMDYLNYVHLTEAYPDSRSKILFLGGCTQATQRMEIDDPYEGDERDVRECYQLLRERTRELATAILAMK